MNDLFKKLGERIGVARFFGKWSSYMVLFLFLAFVFLFVISFYNYLLFHSSVELFSIVVAVLIFVIAWNSRHRLNNNYLLWLGGAYLFIAGVDLVHTLAYEGMGVFLSYEANLPTQLWIGARYMEASALVIAPLLLGYKRKIDISYSIYLYSITTVALFLLVFSGYFPVCFVEGSGLTQFKVISEYIISILLVLGLYLLYKKREEFDRGIFNLLAVALVLTVFSEIAFTFYVDVYGFSNLVGHFFKLISFYLVYRALIVTGIREPFSLLFREKEEAVDRENFLHSLLRHDVQNKAQVVEGYLGLLKENPEGNKGYVDKALQAVKESEDIIEKVRTLREVEKEEIKEIDLKPLIQEVLEKNSTRAKEKGIEIIENCPYKSCRVKAGSLLKKLFNNLIENAINHSDGTKIKISGKEKEDTVICFIEDHGKGIPDENKDKIFRRGFKDKETGGTGLGLYLVKEIIQSYEGNIEVKDSELGGARFDITLEKP